MTQGLFTRATPRTISTKYDREQTAVERKSRLNRSSNGAVNLERMLGEAWRLALLVCGSMITTYPYRLVVIEAVPTFQHVYRQRTLDTTITCVLVTIASHTSAFAFTSPASTVRVK